MSHRVYPRLDHAPLDTERHQVKALFGRNAPVYGAAMQLICDAYGVSTTWSVTRPVQPQAS